MKHVEPLLTLLGARLAVTGVGAITDEDFYGQSPPVYPSRE